MTMSYATYTAMYISGDFPTSFKQIRVRTPDVSSRHETRIEFPRERRARRRAADASAARIKRSFA